MGQIKRLSTWKRGRAVVDLFTKTYWMICLPILLFLGSMMLLTEPQTTPPAIIVKSPPSSPIIQATEENAQPECEVTPVFLGLKDIDSPFPNSGIPVHVFQFSSMNIPLPKYPASELLLVSAVSNNTYDRKIAQQYTFGRIYTIRFVSWNEFPHCVLCEPDDQDDLCHCPPFTKGCSEFVFFDKPFGWWCHTRKGLFSISAALKEWKGDEYPKWLVFMDDNTFINPVSMALLMSHLDPDEPYFFGDTMIHGSIAAGGAGAMISRAVIKKLMGTPVSPTVTYRWPNGTHTVTVNNQLEYCLAQMQGGDWCYYHGDWSVSQCIGDVSTRPIDLGGNNHGGIFSQRYDVLSRKGVSWFYLEGEEMSNVLHVTHAAAAHYPTVDDMYYAFYEVLVPFYLNLRRAYNGSVSLEN